jgi:two-component system, sensor histidine kinase
LTVKSRLGVGSSFTLLLPLMPCEAPPNAPLHTDTSTPPTAPTSGDAPGGTPRTATNPLPLGASTPHSWRVMVAEDHPVNRKVMHALLSKLNCTVTFCENGQEAVDAVARETFDLVFMDIHMPVMDGLAATRLIRQSGVGPQTLPIIALTADVMNEARENTRKAGLNEFLTKPIRLHELEQALGRWLPLSVQTG